MTPITPEQRARLRDATERFRKADEYLEDHPGQIRQQDIDERDSSQKLLSYQMLNYGILVLDYIDTLEAENERLRNDIVSNCEHSYSTCQFVTGSIPNPDECYCLAAAHEGVDEMNKREEQS